MFEKFDGSGRPPRPVQVEILSWLAQNWQSADFIAPICPTGAGKTAISRAIQIEFPEAIILCPENQLVHQGVRAYPEINHFIGKEHYRCHAAPPFSCEVRQNKSKVACQNCPHSEARARALGGVPTVANTHSFALLRFLDGYVRPRVIILDEAHRILDNLRQFSVISFSRNKWKWPSKAAHSEHAFVTWMRSEIYQLKLALKQAPMDLLPGKRKTLKTLKRILDNFRSAPQDFAIAYRFENEREYLDVKPVRLPPSLVSSFFGGSKVILLSATLLPADVAELAGDRSYLIADFPSPIPVERRPIYYQPVNYRMNFETPPKRIAASIEEILAGYGDNLPNTIIHVTFDLSAKLSPHLKRKHHVNTRDNKPEILARFKAEGGIFLAAGFAEGVDLIGDLARVNIIPKLLIPNFRDTFIEKRRGLPGGTRWLNEQVMKTVVQQAGRTTRDATDYSETWILDPNFSRFYGAVASSLPAFFKDAIHWNGKPTA